MEMNYLWVLLTCFIGLFMGVLISFMSKEELKDGRKYFLFSKKVIFVLIIFFLIYFLNVKLIYNLLIAVILLLVLFKFKIKEYITYNLLGIIFYLSSLNESLFKINASLIFIYGLFVGGLFTEKNPRFNLKFIKELFLNYVWFLVLGAMFLFF